MAAAATPLQPEKLFHHARVAGFAVVEFKVVNIVPSLCRSGIDNCRLIDGTLTTDRAFHAARQRRLQETREADEQPDEHHCLESFAKHAWVRIACVNVRFLRDVGCFSFRVPGVAKVGPLGRQFVVICVSDSRPSAGYV